VTDRLLIFVSGLSWKLFAGLFTSCSMFFGVVIGEMTTNQLGLAGIAGAVATALAGIVLVVPRVMEQRRKSRESAAKLQSDLLTKMTDLHKSEVDFYKAQLAAERLIITLERKSKHKAVNEWGAVCTAYRILAAQLRAHDITPEIQITPKSYEEIVGDEDSKIEQINKSRIEESAPAKYPAAPE
jgi:hypothetical protein